MNLYFLSKINERFHGVSTWSMLKSSSSILQSCGFHTDVRNQCLQPCFILFFTLNGIDIVKNKSLLESPVVYFQASVNLIQNLEKHLFFQLTNGVKKIYFYQYKSPKKSLQNQTDRTDLEEMQRQTSTVNFWFSTIRIFSC